jgi:uncharacterized membrane protein YfcA
MELMELIAVFLITSASLNGLMILLKKYLEDNKTFKKAKPAIPPVVGAIVGLIVGLMTVGGVLYIVGGLALGFLAGSMSTTSYELFQTFIKRKVEEA